jgi:type I restriction enzyme M protein
VKAELGAWLAAAHGGEEAVLKSSIGYAVSKGQIGEDGQYNLSVERYREDRKANSAFPMVALGEVCELYQPKTITQADLIEDGPYQVYGANGIIGRYDQYNHEQSEVLITCRGATCGTINRSEPKSWVTGNAMIASPRDENLSKDYLYSLLTTSDLSSTISGSAQPQITRQGLAPFKIPLPPLEVQREIVAEIEGYQKVIDGARAVLESYRPHIPIDSAWPMVEIGKFCSLAGKITTDVDLSKPYFGADSFEANTGKLLKTETAENQRVNGPVYEFSGRRLLYSKIRPYLNKLTIVDLEGYCSSDMYPLTVDEAVADLDYLAINMLSDSFQTAIRGFYERASIPKINRGQLFSTKIPLPPIATQQAIVAEIETEQALVAANRKLTTRFETKIEKAIARVWSGAEEVATDG